MVVEKNAGIMGRFFNNHYKSFVIDNQSGLKPNEILEIAIGPPDRSELYGHSYNIFPVQKPGQNRPANNFHLPA